MTIDIRTRDERVSDAPGTGVLDVARVDGRSVVRSAYATSPLGWLTPRNHGDAAWVYASSYGGGLVGGDALRVRIDVGADATAFVSSQASTKVYRSHAPLVAAPRGRRRRGGQLIALARSRRLLRRFDATGRTQRVELGGGASLLLVDTMTSGRRASGERWQFAEYASRLTRRYDGRLVLLDATRRLAAEGDLAARMGRFDVLSAVAIVGPR